MTMATNKKLRTPIIKPRTQGGTFYTFGSALEDIGLNINNSSNKVEISHYALLDIPQFNDSSLNTKGSYSGDQEGDYIFAEYFQDAILNMETVLRNQTSYNYSASKTVSERVFWKWIFKNKDVNDFTKTDDDKYYYENGNKPSIVKSYGKIVSGSQRIDSYGIYNETFVQIPSSYGQMEVLFKVISDENYWEGEGAKYYSTNEGIIEGISQDELTDSSALIATGISGEGIFDNDSSTVYTAESDKDMFEIELDIDKLREHYDNSELTYDDIAFGNVEYSADANISPDSFKFNAILVYYSVYDSAGKTTLATNAFGVYILDNAIKSGSNFYFPELTKSKTTENSAGTSFSFRINIKPTSAYSGDIVVSDNSTTAFSDSEDFNDIVKNLSKSVEILKSNARGMYQLAVDNQSIKRLTADAIDKIDDLSRAVEDIRTTNEFDTIVTKQVLSRTYGNLSYDAGYIANQILNNVKVTFDTDGSEPLMSITIDKNGLSGDALKVAESIMTVGSDNKTYCDSTKLLVLLLAARR